MVSFQSGNSDLYLMTDCELVKASYWYLEHQGKRQNGVAKCLSFNNPKLLSLVVSNLFPSVILPVALWLTSNTLLTSVAILSWSCTGSSNQLTHWVNSSATWEPRLLVKAIFSSDLLFDPKSDPSVSKVVQQLGFVGLQLYCNWKFFSSRLIKVISPFTFFLKGLKSCAEFIFLILVRSTGLSTWNFFVSFRYLWRVSW